MKVALVYDRINKWGGAERILLLLQEFFPHAPLFTSVYNRDNAAWADSFSIQTSFLQKFPFARSAHEWYPVLMPLAFESFNFDGYDLVISITSEAAKGIMTKTQTKHICICLTPTRYLWSGHDEYFKNVLFKFFTRPLVLYLQVWDKIAASRPDAYIAISAEVQRRIKKYYERDSQLIYPPLSLAPIVQPPAPRPKNIMNKRDTLEARRSSYFLVVSRLVPMKRIDIAIKACNLLQLPLKIIGTGSEEKRLKEIAGSTISFLGNLTDSELVGYYKGCCALLFPGIEDFGLTILEAQSFGKPVIAYQAGGALETIIAGKTGEFFNPQNETALAGTISELIKSGKLVLDCIDQTYYQEACIQQAGKFNKEVFKQKLEIYIEEVMKNKL